MQSKWSNAIYLLSYFRTSDEALHLASSDDGLTWTALNANRAILHADVGQRSVRDPFIRCCEDGWFHLVCTDSWNSPDILHARSRDLVEWEPWEILPVMRGVPNACNAWAPEYVYVPDRRSYMLFWSSITEPAEHQRIWCCETPDFRVISEAGVLFDPGHSVIDATLIPDGDRHVLIYKDERGRNAPGTDFKAMRSATGRSLNGPFIPEGGLITEPLTEGPTVFLHGDSYLMLYDFFLDGRWGASQSEDLLTWRSIPGLTVPFEARHGSVFSAPDTVVQELAGGRLISKSEISARR
jgi:beta-galactosidase